MQPFVGYVGPLVIQSSSFPPTFCFIITFLSSHGSSSYFLPEEHLHNDYWTAAAIVLLYYMSLFTG